MADTNSNRAAPQPAPRNGLEKKGGQSVVTPPPRPRDRSEQPPAPPTGGNRGPVIVSARNIYYMTVSYLGDPPTLGPGPDPEPTPDTT